MNQAIDQLLKKSVRRHSHQKDKPEPCTEQGKHKETICKEAETLPARNISRESDDEWNSRALLETMDTDWCIQKLVRTEPEGSECTQCKIEDTIQYWAAQEKKAAMNYRRVRMHWSISYVVLKHPLWYIKFPLSCVGQNDLCMYYTCNVFVWVWISS